MGSPWDPSKHLHGPEDDHVRVGKAALTFGDFFSSKLSITRPHKVMKNNLL